MLVKFTDSTLLLKKLCQTANCAVIYILTHLGRAIQRATDALVLPFAACTDSYPWVTSILCIHTVIEYLDM